MIGSALLIGLVALSLGLRAAPDPEPPEPPRPSAPRALVLVVAASQAGARDAVLGALRPRLTGLPVTVRVYTVLELPTGLAPLLALARRLQQAEAALAVCWWEAPPGDRVFLFVRTGDGDRLVARAVTGLDEASRHEATALILDQATRTLLAGGQVDAPVVPAPPPRFRLPPPPAPPAPPPVPARPGPPPPTVSRRAVLAFELAYTLEGFSAAPPVVHGIRATLVWNLPRGFALLFGLGFSGPVRADGLRASLELRRFPLQLDVRRTWKRGRLTLGPSLGVTLDPVDLEVTSAIAYPSRDRSDLLVALVPGLVAGFAPTPRLRLTLALELAVYLINPRYVVAGDAVREVLLAPWPVRPRLVAGFAVDLW
jgi:hypothetical protein